jgi:hypothetical protein
MKLIASLLLVAAVSAAPQTSWSVGATCADNILVIARGSTEPGNVVSNYLLLHYLLPRELVIFLSGLRLEQTRTDSSLGRHYWLPSM